ncbi:PH domain-containing protein [Paenibacillus chibensis]|uniref:PH domain-containing protein n=1 Tax=Paenibacillus chibensis TaxID=59846 RepID=UPI000FD9A689|nr:PH domain-containing protein [Paenibacillus chibensis]MEC0368934.1 PH domain-containing protein [Paenibacillus chibensis]
MSNQGGSATRGALVWSGRKCTIFGLPISFTKYFVYEKRLVTRRGFFNLVEDELDFYKVLDKSIVLPFWQRVFGCGSIHLNVADVDTPIKVLESIKHPREVYDQIDSIVTGLAGNNSLRTAASILGSVNQGEFLN